MSATKSQLEKQFNRAKNLGWIPLFEEAAKTITNGYFDAADLLALGSRETNLDPKWLEKAGDGGHGYGLLQADVRSYPEWIRSGKWRDAREGILMGARVLMQKWADYENNIGKKSFAQDSHSKTKYYFTGVRAEGAAAQHIVLSGYNCGRWAQYAYAHSQDIDRHSTGGDYGADVMARAAIFRSLLKTSISTGTPTIAESEEAKPKGSFQSTVDNPPENLANDSAENSAAPENEKQVICKERPSTFVRWLTAIKLTFGAALASLSAKCGNDELQTQLASKAIENANHDTLSVVLPILLYTLIGVAAGAFLMWLAAWFYDRSANRANNLNQQKLAIASNKNLITTELNANKQVEPYQWMSTPLSQPVCAPPSIVGNTITL